VACGANREIGGSRHAPGEILRDTDRRDVIIGWHQQELAVSVPLVLLHPMVAAAAHTPAISGQLSGAVIMRRAQ